MDRGFAITAIVVGVSCSSTPGMLSCALRANLPAFSITSEGRGLGVLRSGSFSQKPANPLCDWNGAG